MLKSKMTWRTLTPLPLAPKGMSLKKWRSHLEHAFGTHIRGKHVCSHSQKIRESYEAFVHRAIEATFVFIQSLNLEQLELPLIGDYYRFLVNAMAVLDQKITHKNHFPELFPYIIQSRGPSGELLDKWGNPQHDESDWESDSVSEISSVDDYQIDNMSIQTKQSDLDTDITTTSLTPVSLLAHETNLPSSLPIPPDFSEFSTCSLPSATFLPHPQEHLAENTNNAVDFQRNTLSFPQILGSRILTHEGWKDFILRFPYGVLLFRPIELRTPQATVIPIGHPGPHPHFWVLQTGKNVQLIISTPDGFMVWLPYAVNIDNICYFFALRGETGYPLPSTWKAPISQF